MRDLISEARVLLVDAQNIYNMHSTLRCVDYHTQVTNLISELEHKRGTGFRHRLRDLMFEDTTKEVEKERKLSDVVFLLKKCLLCKCANCLDIHEHCVCKSCLYGSHVVDCDLKIRESVLDQEVVVSDYTNIRSKVDIMTGKAVISGDDRNGIRREGIPL